MIAVTGVKKVFQARERAVTALKEIHLQVAEGEFFVLLGPSGSGKTTLLRCIAGLETPDEGDILLGDRLVYSSSRRVNLGPEYRGIGMVFQSYAIWPHMTVFENIALPLKHGKRKIPKSMVRERVHKVLGLINMEGYANRPAPQLSGGQQQRVALARALAVEPSLLLMDEPLSNLDARLREEVRTELKAVVRRVGLTVLYVTHDQTEAMDLADRAAVMHGGEILQVGRAEDLYAYPVEPRVGQFLGSMNWIRGKVQAGEKVMTPLGVLHITGTDGAAPGTPVLLGVRPECVELSNDPHRGDSDAGSFPCKIISETFMGNYRVYSLTVGSQTLVANRMSSERLEGQLYVQIPRANIRLFVDKGTEPAEIG
ncbi:MAG TPA: ABC transporter ATP-binding protein [Candidatus Binatia bacterium]